MVRAFDGSRRMVHEEVDLPIKVGSQVFDSTFYMMNIRPAYSCFLGCPWIHGAGAKYSVKGKIITVCGEEEYMVNHLNSFKYVEMYGEFIETPRQTFEATPLIISVAKAISRVTNDPPRMASLKDARAMVEEGGFTISGQLPDIPYKSNKFDLDFTRGSENCLSCSFQKTTNQRQ